MAEDKKDLFHGFDALSTMLYKDDGSDEPKAKAKVDDDDVDEPDTVADDDDTTDDVAGTDEPDKVDDDDKGDDDDKKPDEPAEDLSQYEGEVSAYFATDLAEKLGIAIPEDMEVKTLDDVVDLLVQVVKENSKPTFANEELESLNKFVAEGGDIKTYYNEVYSDTLNLDNVDISIDRDQKAILREHMLNQGYKEEKIKRALDRYEDAGVLQDEAEEALELVKEFREKKAKKLLAEQEKFALDEQKAKQDFVETVYSTVGQLKTVRGVTISESERKELLDYMFKTDKAGLTPMQKDYQDPSKRINNLIETAYFMKYADKIISENKKQGEKKAIEDIRKKFKAGKEKRSAGGNTSFSGTSEPLMKIGALLNK